jgi:hypothetical protein
LHAAYTRARAEVEAGEREAAAPPSKGFSVKRLIKAPSLREGCVCVIVGALLPRRKRGEGYAIVVVVSCACGY